MRAPGETWTMPDPWAFIDGPKPETWPDSWLTADERRAA